MLADPASDQIDFEGPGQGDIPMAVAPASWDHCMPAEKAATKSVANVGVVKLSSQEEQTWGMHNRRGCDCRHNCIDRHACIRLLMHFHVCCHPGACMRKCHTHAKAACSPRLCTKMLQMQPSSRPVLPWPVQTCTLPCNAMHQKQQHAVQCTSCHSSSSSTVGCRAVCGMYD